MCAIGLEELNKLGEDGWLLIKSSEPLPGVELGLFVREMAEVAGRHICYDAHMAVYIGGGYNKMTEQLECEKCGRRFTQKERKEYCEENVEVSRMDWEAAEV